MLSWFRCGDVDGDNTSQNDDSTNSTFDSATAQISIIAGAGRETGETDFEFGFLTSQSGSLLNGWHIIRQFLTGCVPPQYLVEHPCAYPRDDVYDNFNVQHQIPRMSKQYAWITGSLVSDNDYQDSHQQITK